MARRLVMIVHVGDGVNGAAGTHLSPGLVPKVTV